MDPREYRDARWHSLLREAEDLGVAPEEAPGLVEGVLGSQERRIRRSADPDPLVREALHDAVDPRPAGRGGRRVLAVGAALALLVGGGTAYRELTRPDPPGDQLRGDQVPSLFGYDGPTAAQVLKDRGMRVHLQPFQSCEVLDRVTGADPPTGTPYHRGDPITVYTALPSDITCLTDYQDRATAWALLDFANGRGRAPRFAHHVVVYGGDGQRLLLTRRAAGHREAWEPSGVLDGLRAASDAVSLATTEPATYAVPAIRIVPATTGLGSCAAPGPTVTGSHDAFSVLIQPPDRQGCGVRLTVYRDGRAIVAVAYYPVA
ncbi:hypothetical protein [Nocardioides mangrovi]|uniref:PASTA domain-containing protein n=1 Tax=Nocardioides mangrovi TaxID=2874580 RepID=A0ABS7UA80_9ACTN|nr:hypothetical protein [Nocardioides mangrovi]MBZ5737866.1 hypothetical protein [Nocardioides mangrovi]